MTFSGPYEGIQRPYGRIWAGGEKKSKPWLPTGVRQNMDFDIKPPETNCHGCNSAN